MDRQYSESDLLKRARDLSQDRDLLDSGWTPDAETLSHWPLIDDWQAINRGGSIIRLRGVVNDHPRFPGVRDVTTARIVAIDEAAGWCRTEGRFYRLGTKFEPDYDQSDASSYKF
jgi:hypothetical protein